MVLVLDNYDLSILQSNCAINHKKVDIFQPEGAKINENKIKACLLEAHMNSEKYVACKTNVYSEVDLYALFALFARPMFIVQGKNNDQLKGFTVGTANARLAPVPLHNLNNPSCRLFMNHYNR